MQVWLFDIDGTLIVSGGAGQDAAVAALVSAFGITATRDGIQFAGRTDRAITKDLFEAHGMECTPECWARFQTDYLQHLERLLKERQGYVLAGVTELLAFLSQQPDTYLGLLTGNIRAGAEIKLRHYGLWDTFDFGGYGDDHFSRNDVARSALIDAQRHVPHPIQPDQVWVVGDTEHDIHCARAIGAKVIAVTTGGYSASDLEIHSPDLLLDDLHGVRPALF